MGSTLRTASSNDSTKALSGARGTRAREPPDGWSARQTFNGELPGRGIKKVAVVSPAFASDCLEALEEINVGNREMFEHAGGERFTYIPCLNDNDDHIAFLEGLALNELQGWL